MGSKVYDPTRKRWVWAQHDRWDGSAWSHGATKDAGVSFRSIFDPYIGAGTVLTRSPVGVTPAANSSALATWMYDNARPQGFGSYTAFNTHSYGTRPIPAYVVDSTAPGCEFAVMDSAGNTATSAMILGPIPWPSWALPASQGDQSIAIYDVGTGIMREYFLVTLVSAASGSTPAHWRANSGAYSVNTPGLLSLATDNYSLQTREGTSAAVGMHNPLGFIGTAEARQGRIQHAVAFTCANMYAGICWPARAKDGTSTDPNAPREGQWCWLPSTFDADGYVSPRVGRHLNPFERLIVRAFIEFGGFATDKNLAAHAFNAENASTEVYWTGVDPWASGGEIDTLYGGVNFDVNAFPWECTVWAPVDYGRPTPDFGLRPGQTDPWCPIAADNGDGTWRTITGTPVDNGDGTWTWSSSALVDNGNGTWTTTD